MSVNVKLLLEQAYEQIKNNDLIKTKKLLEEILSFDPENFQANFLMGVLYGINRNHFLAQDYFKKATQLQPGNFFANFNYAKCLMELDKNNESIIYHLKALELEPNNKEALVNYGISLFKIGEYVMSLECYNKALSIDSEFCEALINKSNTLIELNQIEEALIYLDKAELIKKLSGLVYYNKAIAFSKLGLLEDSIKFYDKTIELEPNNQNAYYYKGTILAKLGLYNESIEFLKKALSFNDKKEYLFGDYIYSKLRICEWNEFEKDIINLHQHLENNQLVISPIKLLALSDSTELQFNVAKNYIDYKYNKKINFLFNKSKNKRINIGYFSYDFRRHPVAFSIKQVLDLHDKESFNLFGFSFNKFPYEDINNANITGCFLEENFINCFNLSNSEILDLIRKLNIDIAISLGIPDPENHRIYHLFSNRAAPIQISYLGYPGTSGASFMDYIIADETTIPLNNRKYFTEKIIYLPNCYLPNDNRKVSTIQILEENLIFKDKFIYCCFHSNYKLNPKLFNSWMNILIKTKESIIWLLEDNEIAIQNLKLFAKKRGISPERIMFAKKVISNCDHFNRYRLSSLYLDAFPYNAHSTASDALLHGLPILTIMGDSFHSRVSASLLKSIGLEELITTNFDEYENLAVSLCNDSKKLSFIKNKLKKNIIEKSLFNTKLYASKLEIGFKKVYENYLNKIPAEDIYIN